jgi:hypothetical protein
MPTPSAPAVPGDSIAEIIELYKRDVDRSLLRRQLARTPEERLRDLMERQALVEELRRGRSQAQRTH